MERLKNDLMKKSRLIEPSKSPDNLSSKKSKIQNIYRFALNNRGGTIIACSTGGTVGFVCSWFSVGAILVAPPTLLSVFLLRSLAQQIQHNVEYIKLKNIIGKFLNDKNSQEEITNIFIKA